MQLTQFNPSVNKNINQSRVRVPDNALAYGNDASGLTAINHALAQTGEIAGRVWMRDQNNKVVDAANDYNRQVNSLLYDEDNGLYKSMQGANAVGLQDAYTKAEQKIREDVIQKYGLSSDYANRAFLNQVDGSVTSNLEAIDKYQREEADKHRNIQINDLMDNATNMIIRTPNLFSTAVGTFTNTARALLAGAGQDPDTINANMKKMVNAMAESTLSTMSTTGDYKNGLDLVAQYRGMGADEAILKKYENGMLGKEITMQTQKIVGDWMDKNNINPLTDNMDDAYARFEKDNPIEYGNVMGIETGNQNYDKWDSDFRAAQVEYGLTDQEVRILKAMCMQESTFDQTKTNGDAAGPFQFKSDTASEMGITDRMDPHQSIMAAAKYFKENRDKLGSDELAVLAHGGGPNGVEAARNDGYLKLVQEKYSQLYPGGSGGDAAFEAAKNAFMGTIPQNGPEGCVEAATEIASYYSPFMKDEYDRGVVNVDTLVDDADKKGMVISYDPDKVEKGDIIVYDTPAEKQGHVTVANGSGGYVGNMSSANGGQGGIGESSDINDPGTPVKIIKLGLNAGNYGGSSAEEISGYQEKRKAAFKAAWAERLQTLQQDNRRTILEIKQHMASNPDMTPYQRQDYINSMMENHPNLQYSDEALGMKISANNSVKSFEAQMARAGSRASGSGTSNTINSNGVQRIKALIENGTIRNNKDLGDFLEAGNFNLSDTDLNTIQKYLADRTNGTGAFSVKIPWKAEDLASDMGLKASDIPDYKLEMAKVKTRAWVWDDKDETGHMPSDNDIRKRMEYYLYEDVDAGTGTVSRADLGLAGIADVIDIGNPNYQIVRFNDGRTYTVYRGDVDKLLNGSMSQSDLDFDQQQGMMS